MRYPSNRQNCGFLIILLVLILGGCAPAIQSAYFTIKGESAQFKKKSLDTALEYYERAIIKNPDHAKAYARAGWIWYDHKKSYPKAIDYFKTALSIEPELSQDRDFRIYKGLWGSYDGMYKWQEAIVYGKQALAVDANGPEVHYMLNGIGRAFMHLDEFRQALTYFNRAVEKVPDYLPPYGHIAFCHLNMGKPDEGLEILNRALAKTPEDSGLRTTRAWYYVLTGETDKALQDSHKIIVPGPTGLGKTALNLFRVRGRIYLDLEKYEQAIKHLSRSGEKTFYVLVDRSLAHLRSGSYGKAADDYRAALKAPRPSHRTVEGKLYIDRLALLKSEMTRIKRITEKTISE